MDKYKEVIDALRDELSAKVSPGPILDEIMFRRLETFSKNLEHNHDLLLIGATLGDIRIDEARAKGDKDAHVKLALDYAREVYKKYSISSEDQDVIDEVIRTHHGGAQKYTESKIYKNADNFKFLETRGCFHFFGALYTQHDSTGLNDVVERVKGKLNEKLELTDLNENVVIEAKELYRTNMEILNRILLTNGQKIF